MNIRYHQEIESKRIFTKHSYEKLPNKTYMNSYTSEKEGLIILEDQPQAKKFYNRSRIITVNFPYLVFALKYAIYENSLIYHGIYYNGFQVFANNQPLKTIHDKVYCCPTELGYRYLKPICTDHALDFTVYPDVKSMVKTIINSWWQLDHFDGRCTGSRFFYLPIKDICQNSDIFNEKNSSSLMTALTFSDFSYYTLPDYPIQTLINKPL